MTSSKPLVIVLLGPTAGGKTELAIEIAQAMKLRIHNVDSRQLYVGMDIGTAKPSKQQLNKVPHSLINLREPNHPITLKEFQDEAQKSLKESINKEGMAFMAGGSGLYLKAIIEGLSPPAVKPQKNLREQLSNLGQELCHQMLQIADSEAAKRISKADQLRTQRALEVLYATGKTMSEQQGAKPPPWRFLELGLDPKDLGERINQRTIYLYENGLIEETKTLINRFGTDLKMLETIGYKEALAVIQGDITTNEAIQITTRRTKQFAKRQRTWFRNQHSPYWLKSDEPLREAMSAIQSGLV